MLTLFYVIFAVIGFALALISVRISPDDDDGGVPDLDEVLIPSLSTMALFSGPFAGLFCAYLIIDSGTEKAGIKRELIDTFPIYSLHDQTELKVSTYYRRVNINNFDYFLFYRRNADGSLWRDKIPVSNSVIYENDSIEARIEVYRNVYAGQNLVTRYLKPELASSTYYSIHVPNQTASMKFDVK